MVFVLFQSHRVPKLHQEFWEVPLNLQEKCLVSGSQNRNRYRGVLPNEHSRVILPGLQSYIHANYIKVCVLWFSSQFVYYRRYCRKVLICLARPKIGLEYGRQLIK